MKKSLRNSALVLLSVVSIAAFSPTDSFATARCLSQKNAQKSSLKKDKDADKVVTRAERDLEKLTRRAASDRTKVENIQSQQAQAVTRIQERKDREVDRAETQRRAFIVSAGELAAQAATCAASGIINGLLGTELECSASDRNALLAQAQRATAAAVNIGLKVKEIQDRAVRTVAAKSREFDPRIRAAVQKETRTLNLIDALNARLPGLQQKAVVAQTNFDRADAALNQYLGL